MIIDVHVHLIGHLRENGCYVHPGMVGGFHAFYLLALHEIYGVDRATSVAAGITAHALANLPVLVLGLALLGREGLSLGRVAQVTEEGSAASFQEVPP